MLIAAFFIENLFVGSRMIYSIVHQTLQAFMMTLEMEIQLIHKDLSLNMWALDGKEIKDFSVLMIGLMSQVLEITLMFKKMFPFQVLT